jgi:secreted trypsin-like serine protease
VISRIARAGAVVLCLTGLVGLLAATAAQAKPLARGSVIGGTPASLQQWGFTAAVLTPTTLCSGSVISSTKVLTAAHCVGNPASMMVRTNSSFAFGGGEVSPVSSASFAPGYAHRIENDLAVLTLRTPTTAPAIQPASPAEDLAYGQPGAGLSVAGFGNRNPIAVSKPQIGLLTAADVSAKRCAIPQFLVCDSGTRAGTAFVKLKSRLTRKRRLKRRVQRTICSGDSGGPMVANTPAGPRLIGIAEASEAPVSKRNPFYYVFCGLKGYPSLHSRASSYLAFIQANIGP